MDDPVKCPECGEVSEWELYLSGDTLLDATGLCSCPECGALLDVDDFE